MAAGRVLSISRFNPDLILAEKGKAKTVDCLNSSRIPHLYLSQLVSPFSELMALARYHIDSAMLSLSTLNYSTSADRDR
jgi:hypothetical protein